MSQAPQDEDGELHTLGIIEQLRDQCRSLWGTTTDLYFRIDELIRQVGNPNIPEIHANLPYRIEMWDNRGQHVRWTVAVCTNVTIARGAYEIAVKEYPKYEWTLRKGAHVVCKHEPIEA